MAHSNIVVHKSGLITLSLWGRASNTDREKERESRSFLSCKAWEKWNLNASHWLSNSSCLYWCTGLLPTRGLFHIKGSAFTHTHTQTHACTHKHTHARTHIHSSSPVSMKCTPTSICTSGLYPWCPPPCVILDIKKATQSAIQCAIQTSICHLKVYKTPSILRASGNTAKLKHSHYNRSCFEAQSDSVCFETCADPNLI